MTNDDNVIILEKVSISKTDISKMSAETKRQYLMLTNMVSDLDLLRKFLLFVKPDTPENKVLKPEFVTLSFFILRVLIGKINEIWKFFKDVGILNQKSNFSKETKSKLGKVEEFFTDKKTTDIVNFIRNKFAFHYDTYLDIVQPISDAMDKHKEIEWLCSTDAGNDIFSSSNTIMLEIILQRMRKNGFEGDENILLDKLLKLTINMSFHLREFCVSYLTEVILKGIKFKPRGKIQARVPLLSQVNLPLLVKNDMAK